MKVIPLPILILLFTVVPVAELYLLVRIGSATSAEAVLALVLFTGIAGAALARRQGVGLLRRMQAELDAGQLPAEGMLDGLLILIGAAFLITPGVMTDAAGLAMLLPFTRRAFKAWLKRWFQRRIDLGQIHVNTSFGGKYDAREGVEYDIDMDDKPRT